MAMPVADKALSMERIALHNSFGDCFTFARHFSCAETIACYTWQCLGANTLWQKR